MIENDSTDIHSTYLHWIEQASAYRLAEIAECAAPNSRSSLGAEILEEVRDATVLAWRERRYDWETDRFDGDVSNECAQEGIIPPESHQRALLFLDLCAYQEQSEFTSDGTWSGAIEDIMVEAISQITDRAARLMIMEIRRDFKDLWVCPGCGDTGEPHICLPGECNGSEEEQEAHAASQATPEPVAIPTPTQATPDTGETASVAPGGFSDPLLTLMDRVEAERAQADAGTTQGFLTRIGAINRAEFARIKRRNRVAKLAMACIALVTLAVVAWAVF